ncbi:hypothetical protein JKP88DRAFT_244608 [Tribonema minus]|uniref:N-acetyltransferase domain-containing protein n=1 Tax=Tribonema minus TaxID=303371 RepID=A0A835Z2U0_9STRA|nr:hypothetical protein JKP88DRAFT_244608 [Tribonema minus]
MKYEMHQLCEVRAQLEKFNERHACDAQWVESHGARHDSDSQCVIATREGDDKVVGYMIIVPRTCSSDVMCIYSTVVRRGMRKQGVCRAMLDLAKEHYSRFWSVCSISVAPVWLRLGATVKPRQGFYAEYELEINATPVKQWS